MGAIASSLCFCFSAASCACSTVSCCCGGSMGPKGVTSSMAKLGYVTMLGFSALASLLLRFADNESSPDPYYCDLGFGVRVVCDERGSVYRLSLALVALFSVMMLGTIYVPTFTGEKRWGPLLGEGFHRGWWGIKLLVYLGLSVGSLFIPSEADGGAFSDEDWRAVCRTVSALFLILQVLTLIDFAYQWNEDWVWRAFEGGDDAVSPGWMYGLLACALTLYGLAVTGIVLLYTVYSDCPTAVTYTSVTLVLVAIFTVVTLFRDRIVGEDHPGAVLPSAVVAFYVVFQCWSAVESKPDARCRQGGNDTLSIVVGVLFATVSLMWVSYNISRRATNLVTGKENEDPITEGERDEMGELYRVQGADGEATTVAEQQSAAERGDAAAKTNKKSGTERAAANVGNTNLSELETGDRAYVFHFFMITASMYMAMLFTNWGTVETAVTSTSSSAAVGEVNFWVKIIAQWLAIALYFWTLLVPAILRGREF